jgi:hypothetical protein
LVKLIDRHFFDPLLHFDSACQELCCRFALEGFSRTPFEAATFAGVEEQMGEPEGRLTTLLPFGGVRNIYDSVII